VFVGKAIQYRVLRKVTILQSGLKTAHFEIAIYQCNRSKYNLMDFTKMFLEFQRIKIRLQFYRYTVVKHSLKFRSKILYGK